MKHFALFFEEKEGSTAVVQSLDALDEISVVRRETETGLGGWEPFEWFNCGSLGPKRFRACLHLIYGQRPVDFTRLNEIYMRTARAPLTPFDESGSVGFKMRIAAPWDIPNLPAASPYRRSKSIHVLTKAVRRLSRASFKQLMTQTFAELGIVVFIMVRQDVFRWAISKYHGDGTGKPGHLQFRVASGDVGTEDIPKINIDPSRFGKIVDKCVAIHKVKRWWANEMRDAGVCVHPLRYEDFLGDRLSFFASALGKLDIAIDSHELEQRLMQQTRLKRVHTSDISEYVENHREIIDLYGERLIPW